MLKSSPIFTNDKLGLYLFKYSWKQYESSSSHEFKNIPCFAHNFATSSIYLIRFITWNRLYLGNSFYLTSIWLTKNTTLSLDYPQISKCRECNFFYCYNPQGKLQYYSDINLIYICIGVHRFTFSWQLILWQKNGEKVQLIE